MTCGAKFGEVEADGGKGGKAATVENDVGDGKAVGGKGGKATAIEKVVGGKGGKISAKEKLGVLEGYFFTKKWHQYGRKCGPQVCDVCQGSCFSATREMIEALVGSEVLPAETTGAKVSLGNVDVFLDLLF